MTDLVTLMREGALTVLSGHDDRGPHFRTVVQLDGDVVNALRADQLDAADLKAAWQSHQNTVARAIKGIRRSMNAVVAGLGMAIGGLCAALKVVIAPDAFGAPSFEAIAMALVGYLFAVGVPPIRRWLVSHSVRTFTRILFRNRVPAIRS